MNLISQDINIGNLQGVGRIGTNLTSNNSTAAMRLYDYLNLVLNMMIIGAGIYALINFVLAGYGYLSAGNDPKKIQDATAKIWQSLIGLVVAALAYVIIAFFSGALFGSGGGSVILAPEINIP